VDTTGAGNSFLGAFTVKFQSTRDITEAVIAATVAASFTIEQVGLPIRTLSGGRELWNGEEVASRIERYRAMLKTLTVQ
jgi:fructose-1-phosphate kinase PfkB-like protein